jgi:hypothetical protein
VASKLDPSASEPGRPRDTGAQHAARRGIACLARLTASSESLPFSSRRWQEVVDRVIADVLRAVDASEPRARSFGQRPPTAASTFCSDSALARMRMVPSGLSAWGGQRIWLRRLLSSPQLAVSSHAGWGRSSGQFQKLAASDAGHTQLGV